tara:strand:- start:104 stop:577 length:474 start_codon:yes stop_codon:yes gene_type:complete
VCEIANDNAEGQIIISGNKISVSILREELKENKFKTIPLKVSAPFHCSLMKPAAENMKEKIKKTNFVKPNHDIVNNVTAKEISDPEQIKELLIEQIYSTVRWRESLLNISKKGIKTFVEIGPGKALTGMVKRTIKESNSFSINSIDDIKNFNNEFKR